MHKSKTKRILLAILAGVPLKPHASFEPSYKEELAMSEHYDLTNASGLNKAISPIDGMIYYFKVLKSLIGSSPTSLQQSEAAASVIRAGKESGVDEMDITMSHDAGLNFKAPIDGINISMKAGAEGTITMKVKYK